MKSAKLRPGSYLLVEHQRPGGYSVMMIDQNGDRLLVAHFPESVTRTDAQTQEQARERAALLARALARAGGAKRPRVRFKCQGWK